MELDILTQVLRLYNRGLAVFPVDVQTKAPLVSGYHGLNAVRADEEQVRQWFGGVRRSVGIACGPISNVLLLDFDFAKHPEACQFFESKSFPRTWKEITASGGVHLYFKWVEALNAKQTNTTSFIHRGVDTKGHGGYSKICPSEGYRWEVAPHMSPLAMPPQWLIDALKPKEQPREVVATRADDWMIKELESVDPQDPVRGRTPTFVRAIGRLKAKGLNEVEVRSLLTPWAIKYDYPKLEALVEDQFQRYPPREEVVPNVSNHSLKSFVATRKTIPFIVPGIVGVNTINIWAGLQESRKSWLLLDLAVAVASGTSWLNVYPCLKGKVIIIDQERPGDEMKRRLEALIAGRGLKVDDLEGSLIPKADLDPRFQLNVDESFAAFEKMVDEVRPSLVLIDSLSAIQSGDINSKPDMQKFFERIKAMRLKYGVTFVILHHENKGTYEMMRAKLPVTAENVEGSGVINQVPEGIMVARNFDGESTRVHHVKNSYGTKVAPFIVKVRDITPDKKQIAVEAF